MIKKSFFSSKNLLLSIFLITFFSILVLAEPPQFSSANKIPADINTLNLFTQNLNIAYSITDLAGLNASSVTLFYKTNSTSSDASNYVNATAETGFFNETMTNNNSLYSAVLDHGDVYPTTANLDESIFENTPHSFVTLTNNSAVKMEFLSVSSLKDYNIFMFMANSSVGASPLYEFYCNSSYVSGRTDTNRNCYQFGTLNSTQNFSDSEMNNQYQFVGLTINPATGMIGTVKVTPTSYFLLRKGIGPGLWYIYYINNETRTTAAQTSRNNGAGWTNQIYTFDAHLHQYSGTDTFYYYACASDMLGNQSCSSVGSDLIQLGGISPSVPHVYFPTNNTYSGVITIGYVQSISPNGYNIQYYNISLLNPDGSFYKTITNNNSQSLSYSWDSSSVPDGNYIVEVVATDSLGQISFDLSEPFMINNYHSSQNNLAEQNSNLVNINKILIIVAFSILAIAIIVISIILAKRKRVRKKKGK